MSKNRIYNVVFKKEGEREERHLVRAETIAKARNHVMKVVSVRVATQEDMMSAVGDMVAVGDDPIEIEDAGS